MFDKVAGKSGLTLSVPKTKLLVTGTGLTSDDLAPLELDEGVVDVVDQFKYLGSLVEARGSVVAEVCNRIAEASRAFGSLRNSVFTASDLTLETKRMVYRSVVLGCCCMVLKPGPPPRSWLESWTVSTDAVFVAFWV